MTAASGGAAEGLSPHLTLADFVERLAVHALGGRGPGFQAADADFDAAAFAIAVISGVEGAQGFVDLLQQLAFPIAGAQLEAEVGFLAGPVVGIGKVGRLVLHVVQGAVDLFHQFSLPGLQNRPEMRLLGRVHVLLAVPDRVRLEAFHWGIDGGLARLIGGRHRGTPRYSPDPRGPEQK